jgi:predicted nucleic acid-binding protein
MARVCLETSFFSACVSDRQDAKSIVRQDESRQWWVQQRPHHRLFVSPEVMRELSVPSFPHRDEALALTGEAEMLMIDEETRGLAKILVREKAMPGPEESGDALHLAVATVQRIDVILSWNVKHLANRNKMAHVREVCRRVGYVPPEILTPDTFWETEGE